MIHRAPKQPRHEVAYVKKRIGIERLVAVFSMMIGVGLVLFV